MEVLSSRVLLQPVDFERSFRFYAESLGLHVYREWGSESVRSVVFFLGGSFLELSGSTRTGTSESVGLWLQVLWLIAPSSFRIFASIRAAVFSRPTDRALSASGWVNEPSSVSRS